MMFHAGQKAVLMLEVGIGPRVIAARVDGFGLPNVAPSVAGLGTNMVGEKIAPLPVNLEMRIGIAGGADGGFQLVAAAISEPAS